MNNRTPRQGAKPKGSERTVLVHERKEAVRAARMLIRACRGSRPAILARQSRIALLSVAHLATMAAAEAAAQNR